MRLEDVLTSDIVTDVGADGTMMSYSEIKHVVLKGRTNPNL